MDRRRIGVTSSHGPLWPIVAIERAGIRLPAAPATLGTLGSRLHSAPREPDPTHQQP
jgi:hypothetical protein